MHQFQPRDPSYAGRVAAAFHKGSAASKWGSELRSVSPGVVEIFLSCGDRGVSAEGELHRSCIAALLDDACVLAALSLSSAGDAVTTTEYKVNFLAPASGEGILVCAQVVRPGRSITVCRADAFAGERLVAKMLATFSVSRPA